MVAEAKTQASAPAAAAENGKAAQSGTQAGKAAQADEIQVGTALQVLCFSRTWPRVPTEVLLGIVMVRSRCRHCPAAIKCDYLPLMQFAGCITSGTAGAKARCTAVSGGQGQVEGMLLLPMSSVAVSVGGRVTWTRE